MGAGPFARGEKKPPKKRCGQGEGHCSPEGKGWVLEGGGGFRFLGKPCGGDKDSSARRGGIGPREGRGIYLDGEMGGKKKLVRKQKEGRVFPSVKKTQRKGTRKSSQRKKKSLKGEPKETLEDFSGK